MKNVKNNLWILFFTTSLGATAFMSTDASAMLQEDEVAAAALAHHGAPVAGAVEDRDAKIHTLTKANLLLTKKNQELSQSLNDEKDFTRRLESQLSQTKQKAAEDIAEIRATSSERREKDLAAQKAFLDEQKEIALAASERNGDFFRTTMIAHEAKIRTLTQEVAELKQKLPSLVPVRK